MKTKLIGIATTIAAIIALFLGISNTGVGVVDQQPSNNSQISVPGDDSSFEVHFIDVGEGDAALIICDGEAMLIDGGESEQSSKIYAYLKNQNIVRIKYLVATHGHSDHVGGLSAALNYARVETVLCSTTSYGTDTFEAFLRQLEKQNLTITVPLKGDSYDLGAAKVLVLGPDKVYENDNDNSLALKVIYGSTSFLFVGDAERAAELDLIADDNSNLQATVLKVGHHGSDTSTSYLFLREIMPSYAVISVGADNAYGHPADSVLSRLTDAEVEILRTDLRGTIIMHSDGMSISYTTERSDVQKEDIQHNGYIGNINSKKFHQPDCANLPAEKNRVYFAERQEAIGQGYSPCRNCYP